MPVLKIAEHAEDAYDDIANWNGAYRSPDALPCPFCGYAPMIVKWHNGPRGRMIMCRCDECPVGPQIAGRTEAKALESWNTRC